MASSCDEEYPLGITKWLAYHGAKLCGEDYDDDGGDASLVMMWMMIVVIH